MAYIVTQKPKHTFYRFNSVKFIEQNDVIYLLQKNYLPIFISIQDFFYYKSNYKIETYAIDFIFSRSLYKINRGFPDFPLGWCSDDAFWLLSAKSSGGIITIQDALVYWRFNDLNISGKDDDPRTAKQKIKACILFSKFLRLEKIDKIIGKKYYQYILSWFVVQYEYRKHLLTWFNKIGIWITFYFFNLNLHFFYKKKKDA